jgi:hypothetical protein
MTNKAIKVSTKPPEDELRVVCADGADLNVATATAVVGPYAGNGLALKSINKNTLGPGLALQHYTTALVDGAKAIQSNNLKEVEATLYAQGLALNAMFTSLMVKSAQNFNAGSNYMVVGGDYLKLALKAQNQSRMTFETLAAVKNPPIVYAKQANIANGPQQVNNTIHTHTGETKNSPSKILEQSHEQRMDTGTQSEASAGNSAVEAMAEMHRPTHS